MTVVRRFWPVLWTTLLFMALWTTPAWAQSPCSNSQAHLDEIRSRVQLKEFVHCALAHVEDVGWEQAATDFQTSRDWLDGSMYLFAADQDGIVHFVAGSGTMHPGDDILDLQDSTVHYIVQDLLRIALNYGSGYSYYRIANRNSGLEEPKISYITRMEVDGDPLFFGAGFHPLDAPGACLPEHVRASLVFTESDTEHFVNCAALHLRQHGLRAVYDFQGDPRWVSGPTYLFLLDQNSITITRGTAHQLIGMDQSEVADPDGLLIVQEMHRIVSDYGEGFVYYGYNNPATGQVEPKVSFVRQVFVDGHPYVLGAGLYVPNSECRTASEAHDVDTAAELELYVSCVRSLVEERGTAAFDLLLNHPHWIGGSTYSFVIDQQCQSLVYPLDYRSDEDGCSQVEVDILDVATSEEGQGWVKYQWLNPASNEVETKSSFIMGMELDGETVAIGAGLYLAE